MNIPPFVNAIRNFSPKTPTGDRLDPVNRNLILVGFGGSAQMVQRNSARAHVFKSPTDYLWVFLPETGYDLKIAHGKSPQDVYDMSKAPRLLNAASPELQRAAASVLKEMAVALVHRAT
jgi:hypothetical protein